MLNEHPSVQVNRQATPVLANHRQPPLSLRPSPIHLFTPTLSPALLYKHLVIDQRMLLTARKPGRAISTPVSNVLLLLLFPRRSRYSSNVMQCRGPTPLFCQSPNGPASRQATPRLMPNAAKRPRLGDATTSPDKIPPPSARQPHGQC